MRDILVVFGGKSCEHDISCITGVLTLNSLDKSIYKGIPIYIDKNGEFFTGDILSDISNFKNLEYKKLKKVTFTYSGKACYLKGSKLKEFCSPHVVINCLHGVNGEDGSLKGFFNMYNIPVVGSNIFASSLAIDKEFTKILLKGLDIKTLPYVKVLKTDFYKNEQKTLEYIEQNIKYPLIIKPCRLGSSIGIKTANNYKELKSSLEFSFKYDLKVIIEELLEDFTEINSAVYKGGKIYLSNLEKPVKTTEILSFSDKYTGGKSGAINEFPARLNENLTRQIKEISLNVYKSLDFSGVIRIDYILVGGNVYVNEINTIPGSMAYYLFSDTLKGFSKMLTSLIVQETQNFIDNKNLITTFNSSVLHIKGVKGGKIKN